MERPIFCETRLSRSITSSIMIGEHEMMKGHVSTISQAGPKRRIHVSIGNEVAEKQDAGIAPWWTATSISFMRKCSTMLSAIVSTISPKAEKNRTKKGITSLWFSLSLPTCCATR